MSFMKGRIIFKSIALHLGRFPFVKTDRLDRSRRNENFIFSQNYPARSANS